MGNIKRTGMGIGTDNIKGTGSDNIKVTGTDSAKKRNFAQHCLW